MKIDLTDVSPVRKEMSVEVPVEDVEREKDSLLKSYRAKARIPGFRPGKAPIDVVRKRFKKELEEDIRERVVSSSFVKAAREKGLQPLGDPALDDVSHEDGKPLTFKTTFEVMPEIEPKGFDEIEVTGQVADVKDEDVQEALEQLQKSRVQLVAEEGRLAEQGDVVYIKVTGTPDEGEPFSQERLPIEIGAENNIKQFNEKLVGAGVGGKLEFPVEYPKSYGAENLAGRRVEYAVEVLEVKKPVLPALDDEFAKDLGDFDDLEALKVKIREDLEGRKKHESDMAIRQSVLDKVLIKNPVVLPDVLVEREIHRRLEELVRNMYMQGVDPEKEKIDWVDVRKKQEEPARKAVHARLILDAVARKEEVTIEAKELDERIQEDAKQMGQSPEALRAKLKEHHGTEALKAQMVREKALDYLTSVANIQYAD
jgi:trigger factor